MRTKAQRKKEFDDADEKPICLVCKTTPRLPEFDACNDCKTNEDVHLAQMKSIRVKNAEGKCPTKKELSRLYRDRYNVDLCHVCLKRPKLPPYNGRERKECSKCRDDRDRRDFPRKEAVLFLYGWTCICCGQPVPRFLEVDHKNNDGWKKPPGKRRQNGRNFYRSLVADTPPKDLALQTLCSNCNKAKEYYGKCPHEECRDYYAEIAEQYKGLQIPTDQLQGQIEYGLFARLRQIYVPHPPVEHFDGKRIEHTHRCPRCKQPFDCGRNKEICEFDELLMCYDCREYLARKAFDFVRQALS